MATSYQLKRDCFETPSDGGSHRTARIIGAAAHSDEWQQKQEASLGEYAETHESENLTPLEGTLYRLFENYLSTILLRHYSGAPGATLLDVGCGISPKLPPYVRRIAHAVTYIGLDPLDKNPQRDYLFINGALEDVPVAFANPAFDLFVFSTSLDHFEDIEVAARLVKRLASRKAYAVFFVGLHDPQVVAGQWGSVAYQALFKRLDSIGFAKQAARHALSVPGTLRQLRRRDAQLKAGERLDDLHYYYFTKASLPTHLERFGRVLDYTEVPGTNVVFAYCEIAPAE